MFSPLQPEAGAVPAAIVARAADWLALLGSGNANAAQQARCAAWRAADPRHELAWQRLAAIDRGMQDGGHRHPATAPAARQALTATAERQLRRQFGRWTLGLAAGGFTAWNLRQHTPWPALAAAHRSATGERRTLALPGGTTLHLASATAVDLDDSGSRRRILLRAGEILVETGHADSHPLQVTTADGTVSPEGTRFTVARRTAWNGAAQTEVAVLEGAVAVQPASAGAALHLQAGQQTRFTGATADTPRPLAPGAAAWSDGMLVADRMRLDAFIVELGHWRPGVLRCADDAAALRITGAFPLGDTERVLAMLARILPVQVERRTRWWTTVRAIATAG